MFVILWEFEVKPGNENRFEKAYGPAGAWVQLFQRHPHFRGTQLLQDPSRPQWYFTVDFWESQASYREFLGRYRSDYQELDDSFRELALQQRHIVSFVCQPASPRS